MFTLLAIKYSIQSLFLFTDYCCYFLQEGTTYSWYEDEI